VAGYIADQLWQMYGQNADLRQAVQVARIASGDRGQVEEVLRTLRRQGFSLA